VALTRAEVEHVARLARVAMTEEDIARFQGQLSVILEHFEALRGVPTEGVSPTAHALPLSNVERTDSVRPSLPVEAALANAPQVEGEFIRVRRVLE
jgi:aspartyl-tRNA(Asn)/glutamyl-tRNA(Gln) amidotransferase subunit C